VLLKRESLPSASISTRMIKGHFRPNCTEKRFCGDGRPSPILWNASKQSVRFGRESYNIRQQTILDVFTCPGLPLARWRNGKCVRNKNDIKDCKSDRNPTFKMRQRDVIPLFPIPTHVPFVPKKCHWELFFQFMNYLEFCSVQVLVGVN